MNENIEIRLKQYLDTVGTQLLFATVGSLIKYINRNIGNKLLLWERLLLNRNNNITEEPFAWQWVPHFYGAWMGHCSTATWAAIPQAHYHAFTPAWTVYYFTTVDTFLLEQNLYYKKWNFKEL